MEVCGAGGLCYRSGPGILQKKKVSSNFVNHFLAKRRKFLHNCLGNCKSSQEVAFVSEKGIQIISILLQIISKSGHPHYFVNSITL